MNVIRRLASIAENVTIFLAPIDVIVRLIQPELTVRQIWFKTASQRVSMEVNALIRLAFVINAFVEAHGLVS